MAIWVGGIFLGVGAAKIKEEFHFRCKCRELLGYLFGIGTMGVYQRGLPRYQLEVDTTAVST